MRPVARLVHSSEGGGIGEGAHFAIAPGTPCPRCGRTRGILIGTDGMGHLTETLQPCRAGPRCKPVPVVTKTRAPAPDVPCPSCGATGDEPCTGWKGRSYGTLSGRHDVRTWALRDARKAAPG